MARAARLAALVVGAAALGIAARAYCVRPAKADLTEIERLADETFAAHTAIFARYEAREIDQAALTDAIEAETLPNWSATLARAEELKADGVERGALDDLLRYLRLRRDASEQFVDAIRTNDRELYQRAKQTHREAEAVGATFGGTGRRQEG